MRSRKADQERGSIATIVALALTVLIGFAAIGVDVGRMFIVRDRIHSAADSAVLAGVQQLPGDPVGAVETARTFLTQNGFDPSLTSVTLDPNSIYKLRASVKVPVDMTFARVLGFARQDVSGASAAERLSATSTYGAAPLAVSQDTVFNYGESVTLKAGAGDQFAPGNFGAIQLGKPGANQYRDNLQYGFNGWVEVGEWYSTEPGTIAGPTADALNYRLNQDPYSNHENVDRNSQRLLRIPVINAFPNGKGEFQVVGFAVFFVELAQRKGNVDEVTGRFLRFDIRGKGKADAPGFGAFITRLSQ